jgi:ethanolamine utilization protein EutQ
MSRETAKILVPRWFESMGEHMAHIRHKDDCRAVASPRGEILYELAGCAAGGAVQHSVAQIELPPGNASPKHFHPLAEESFTMLGGEGRMVIDGETLSLSAGQCVVVNPCSVHQMFNDGPEPMHYLAVCVPAWTPDNSVYLD